MTVQLNTYSDISSIVNPILERSLAVARDNNVMAGLVTPFSADGSEPRKFYQYSAVTFNEVGESDDLTSQAFTPSALGTVTPSEWAAQVFMTDQRIATDWNAAAEDAAQELGANMGQKVDETLAGLFNNFTGGSVSHPPAIHLGLLLRGLEQTAREFCADALLLRLHACPMVLARFSRFCRRDRHQQPR